VQKKASSESAVVAKATKAPEKTKERNSRPDRSGMQNHGMDTPAL